MYGSILRLGTSEHANSHQTECTYSDPPALSRDKLAHSLLLYKRRWSSGCSCRQERINTLQFHIGTLEDLFGSTARASFCSPRWAPVVPSCTDRCCRGDTLLSSIFYSSQLDLRRLIRCSYGFTPETSNLATPMSFIGRCCRHRLSYSP